MKYCVPFALLGAPLVFQSVGAHAQTAEKRMETISVSATFRKADIEDIPASVDVLSADDIDTANGLNSAEDITRLLTGVQAAVANGSQIAFQIRGIGAVDHQALTPGAAAIYQDGVFLATNVQTGTMLYDLERIEVLKGPQGTLYGRNASSGAINFLTRNASSEQLNYLEASAGRFERFDTAFGYGDALAENVSYRVAGRYLTQGPTLDNVQTDLNVPKGPDAAGGERDEFGLRGSLFWKTSELTDVLLRAHYERDRGINVTPRNDSLDVDDFEISSEGLGLKDTENDFYGMSLRARTVWNGWDVMSLSAYEGYKQDYGFDFDGSPAPYGSTDFNANLSYDRSYDQWSQELHFQKSFGWGRTLFGGMLSAESFEQRYVIWCGELDPDTYVGTCGYVGAPGRVGPNPASDGDAVTLITDIAQNRTSAALFNYTDFEIGTQTTLTVGARYTYEDIEGSGQGVHVFDDGMQAFNNRDGLGAAVGSNEIEEGRFTGNLALRYKIPDFGAAYASVASGYKSGGFNGEVQNNATHFADEGLFDAETVVAYEIGFKSSPTDTLSWNIAAFYQDYDAPQARIFVAFDLPDGGSITSNSLSNLDAAIAYGIEASASWRPLEGLTLDAGVNLLETEIEQENDLGGNAATFDGNPLPFASETTLRVSARYERELAVNRLGFVSLNAKYNSDYYLDAEGLESRMQDGFVLLDGALGMRFTDSNILLELWGRNLLNEDYAVSGYGFLGYNTFRSEPASYGLRLRWGRNS